MPRQSPSRHAGRDPEQAAEQAGHRPVLLGETVSWLAPASAGRYIDGTFGGGGHTRAVLAASAPDGRVLAIDADPAAIVRARELAKEPSYEGRLVAIQGNFADLARLAASAGFVAADGVLLDLGLSSFQLDEPARGFAFRYDAPLDMRFDPDHGPPAATLVNELPEAELADLLWRLGEERQSRRIARAIALERDRRPIASTVWLAELVERAVGGRRGAPVHPATRTFQALRIATNDEIGALAHGLDAAVDVLAPSGRLVVIAFHSLEDRLVKRFIERESACCLCPPDLPVCICDARPRLAKLTRGAVKPSREEIAANPRARSAVLRAAVRLGSDAGPVALSEPLSVPSSGLGNNPP